jgi:hypothetical protein
MIDSVLFQAVFEAVGVLWALGFAAAYSKLRGFVLYTGTM